MAKFHHAMRNEGLNFQAKKAQERKAATLEIMKFFSEEPNINDPEILVNYACKFALYNIHYEYFEKSNVTPMTNSSVEFCQTLLPPGYSLYSV